MAIDYTKLADTALRLVQESGRDVTFRRLSRTVTDPAKPWRGTATPRTTVSASVTAKAVVVNPDERMLGVLTTDVELVKRSEKIMIVALGSTSTVDLTTYDEVLDGTELWQIGVVETLKPGGTTLLYFVGVKR